MRLFVGTPVPPGPLFQNISDELVALDIGARPVPPGSWHVTLRFLGEVEDPDEVRSALDPVLADAQAMPVQIKGVGAFKDARSARVIWAGVDAPGLERIQASVEAATEALGQPPERRVFRPHVTLARIKRPADLRTFVRHHQDALFSEGVFDQVILWRSGLGPNGPQYTAVATWPLQSL